MSVRAKIAIATPASSLDLVLQLTMALPEWERLSKELDEIDRPQYETSRVKNAIHEVLRKAKASFDHTVEDAKEVS